MVELITGGLGFIGSIYTACAARAGKHCVVVDRDADKKNLLQDLPNVTIIIADLLQREQLLAIMAQHKPQVVHHFAALSAVGAVPDAVFADNVTAMTNLLAAMQACEPQPSLIFSSSCSVYGSCVEMTDESAAVQPVSAYARSKVDGEKLLNTAVRDTQLAGVALRYANVAGAIDGYGERRAKQTHLISNLIAAVLREETATIFGDDFPTPDGTCRRDYVHVQDVVVAHELAVANASKGTCAAFNICSGVSHSNLEVVRVVEQVSGKQVRLNIGARRRGDPATVQLNNAKAAQQLGFVPQHSELTTIVSDAYRWQASLAAVRS